MAKFALGNGNAVVEILETFGGGLIESANSRDEVGRAGGRRESLGNGVRYSGAFAANLIEALAKKGLAGDVAVDAIEVHGGKSGAGASQLGNSFVKELEVAFGQDLKLSEIGEHESRNRVQLVFVLLVRLSRIDAGEAEIRGQLRLGLLFGFAARGSAFGLAKSRGQPDARRWFSHVIHQVPLFCGRRCGAGIALKSSRNLLVADRISAGLNGLLQRSDAILANIGKIGGSGAQLRILHGARRKIRLIELVRVRILGRAGRGSGIGGNDAF